MSKVSNIDSKILQFLNQSENKSLKTLPKEEILSIMTSKGIISASEAKEYLKNSAFQQGYTQNVDVLPKWKGQEKASKTAIATLENSLNYAKSNISSQLKIEGPIAKTVNFIKEALNSENARSNSEKAIIETEKELIELKTARSPEVFKVKFKELRGVEFSQQKIEAFEDKANEMSRLENLKGQIEYVKKNLESSTINNASSTGFKSANKAILDTFIALNIKDKAEINKILNDISKTHENNPILKKYGGDFRISKNKNGEYKIYRTDKSGYPAEATMEELQIIKDEMKLRLNRAYGNAIGAEISADATNEELEKITNEKYSKVKEEYKTAFKEAYGEKNLEEITNNYVISQRQIVGNIQATMDMASMATMFLGSGIILKGANLLTKGNLALNGLTKATIMANKIKPAVIATQVTRPIDLIENTFAQEPNWKDYGLSVAEGTMWMTLGMLTGIAGDKARMFLKQKGLTHLARNTGQTYDSLIALKNSGTNLPKNLLKPIKLIENTAKVSGSTAEFVVDIITTYLIQDSRGENLSIMDYVMSANGAIMGTVMQKDFSRLSKDAKIKFIEQHLKTENPDISPKVLKLTTKELLELNKIAEAKRTEVSGEVKKTEAPEPTKVKTKKAESIDLSKDAPPLTKKVITKENKVTLELDAEGEKIVRQKAQEIHEKAVTKESEIVKIMEEVGLGVDKTSMTHRPKSAQSLYDKIKNAMCDTKDPLHFTDAVKTVRDAVGTRTRLEDFDYKKHPDIVDMLKKDPEKAYRMAAERQSEPYVNKIKEIIISSVNNPKAKIEALKISNYKGSDGIPYFSERQVAELQDFAAQYEVDLHIKNEFSKVRASGYTALQMNFKTKDGFVYEWQLRGSKINKFAECEHVPYDIRENKDVTGGNPLLKRLYNPLQTAVKDLAPEKYKKYNEYLTAHYKHLRLLEMGFESKPPKLAEYGLDNPILDARSLELLHYLADGLKHNKLTEDNALAKYNRGVAKFGNSKH